MPPFLVENALKAQNIIFYKRNFPKEHVEFVVYSLMRLATDPNVWKWPGHVDYGVSAVTSALQAKFKRCRYTTHQVKEVIQKLFERHCVNDRIMNEPGMKYDLAENKFEGDDTVWENLLQEDERCSWYFMLADPMWEDLAIIFDGHNGGYAADTVELTASDEKSEQRSINNGRTFRLATLSEESSPSPVSPFGGNAINNFSPSAGGWNLGIGSPSVQRPMGFASPLDLSSPGVEFGTEEEWKAARKASAEKSAAKRRIILDFTCSSPGGSSSGSSPSVRPATNVTGGAVFFIPKTEK